MPFATASRFCGRRSCRRSARTRTNAARAARIALPLVIFSLSHRTRLNSKTWNVRPVRAWHEVVPLVAALELAMDQPVARARRARQHDHVVRRRTFACALRPAPCGDASRPDHFGHLFHFRRRTRGAPER
jgi:hypothetical protein